MPTTDLTPGTITTLGQLRPGYVGMFVLDEGESKPFVATAERDGGYVVIEYTNGGGVHSILSPVRYLGRGRIEPARIVMDGEPDRAAELEAGLPWTDAKPTVPGWYWHRYGPRDGDAPTVVEIAIHPKRAKLMTVWAAHSTDDWTELLEGQFAGPIPQPEEPK